MNMMKLIKWILPILLFGWISPLSAQIESLDNLIERQSFYPYTLGISVRNIVSSKEVYSLESDHRMIPASSLKVITTFSALDMLGEDFRYETKIGYSGQISTDGTLSGDIWIIGSGDPSLGSPRPELKPHFEDVITQVVKMVQGAGIKCIDGNIVCDASIFDNEYHHPGWQWNDVGNYYGAGVFGINMNENEYELTFKADGPIDSICPIVNINPKIPNIAIQSDVTLAGRRTGDNAYIYGGSNFNHKYVKGTIPKRNRTFTIRGAIPNPPDFFAYHISQALEENNISNSGYDFINKSDKSQNTHINTIGVFRSEPLKELTSQANHKSINLYCEAFLKTISNNGSREGGISRISQNLQQYGIDTLQIMMEDGSGLNSRNTITPALFTTFLQKYWQKWGSEFVLSQLPRTSYEGTVKSLLVNKRSRGQAWLKSGYINKALTYTGYLKSKSGNIYSLSIMANNYNVKTSAIRAKIEEIIEYIYIHY